MHRVVFAFFCAGTLAVLAALSAAQAGDTYYGDGYYPRHRGSVLHSPGCCYRKTVRHECRVRYVRVGGGFNYRQRYYSNCVRPYYPRYHYYSDYYARPYRSYIGYNYSGPNYAGYTGYAIVCTSTRVRVRDGRGGWVWGYRRVCY